MWVNVAFAFPTVRWYVMRMGLGEWDTKQLRAALAAQCSSAVSAHRLERHPGAGWAA